MALHLILLAVNKVCPNLQGSIVLHSNCLGALSRVEELPIDKIPAACKHADILKTILIACDQLTFRRTFQHVKAHQDDCIDFALLSRASQLSCAVDAGAKRVLVKAIEDGERIQNAFPLEPVICFAGSNKLTPAIKLFMIFWIH